jgi:phosphoenolpyruvate carboxylase
MAIVRNLFVDELDDKEKKNILDSELQEFAMQVSMICALEAGGKYTSVEAYKKIKALFKELKTSKRTLFPKSVPPSEGQ